MPVHIILLICDVICICYAMKTCHSIVFCKVIDLIEENTLSPCQDIVFGERPLFILWCVAETCHIIIYRHEYEALSVLGKNNIGCSIVMAVQAG